MTTSNHEPLRPIANIGDLITVKGYGIRTFQVDAFTHEFHYDAETQLEEIYYDVTCVQSFEQLVADQEDIAIVSRAANAPKYLNANIKRPATTAHNPSVDDLLFDLSDALALRERFGDHEDDVRQDRKYALKVCEIKAKIREHTEVYKWDDNTGNYC